MRFIASLFIKLLILTSPVLSQQLFLIPSASVFVNQEESEVRINVDMNELTNDLLQYYTNSGFFEVLVDSVVTSNESGDSKLYLTTGNRYNLTHILVNEQIYEVNSPYESQFVDNFIVQKLDSLEYVGYPFAEVSIIGLELDTDNTTVSVSVNKDKNDFVIPAGIKFTGGRQLSDAYLSREAGFKQNAAFNPSDVQQYQQNLINSPFLRNVSEPGLINHQNEWYLLFEIEEINSSSIDLIVGYNPSAANTSSFVGRGDLRLENLITQGSSAQMYFERLPQTQSRLNIGYTQHWVAELPLNLGMDVHLYQQDSTYFSRQASATASYGLPRGYKIGITLQSRFTDRDGRLADSRIQDGRNQSVNLFLEQRRVNRGYNPTAGFHYRISGTWGFRDIRNAPDDGANLKTSYSYTAAGVFAQYFMPLTDRLVLTPRISGNFKQIEVFFDDDLFRFGGANSLRGYLEEQFRANTYVWGDVELRYLLDRNSYFFVFGASGVYERPDVLGFQDHVFESDVLYSGGFGLSYRVTLGTLRFSYALSPDDSFSNGKVHFGISNSF